MRGLTRAGLVVVMLAASAGAAWAWSTVTTNPGNAITGAVLGAPTDLATVRTPATGNTCTNVDVTWTSAPNADRYLIERQIDLGPWSELAASHATTTYSDATGFTNAFVTWRITPRRSGSTSWQGTPATVSLSCGFASVNDLVVTNPCNSTLLSWTAPPGATEFDIRRQVNGGGWSAALVANQAATTWTDTTAHPTGALVEYQVRPGSGGVDGDWSTASGVSNWDVFRISTVTFGNAGTLGAHEPGDTITMTFNKPVDTTTMTATNVYTRANNPAASRGVLFPATADNNINAVQGGRVLSDGLFSATATLAGTTAWSNSDTTWTWTSTSALVVGMTANLGGTFEVGGSAAGARCAGDAAVAPAATSSPTLAGRW
jgi:hypothetical protein